MSMFFIMGRRPLRKSERALIVVDCELTTDKVTYVCKTNNVSEQGLALFLDKPINIDDEKVLSKKEEYDLNKKKKEEMKIKDSSKKSKSSSKKNKAKKHPQTNLGARIFAIIMLILMILSVIASAGAYLIG